jgi:hypothetical protein
LRVRAEALDIAVRQQILRLLVKDVLVGGSTITLRHSIPIPQSGPGSSGSPVPCAGVTESRSNPGYLLRSGSHYPALRSPALGGKQLPFAIASCLEHCPNQAQHSPVGYPLGN